MDEGCSSKVTSVDHALECLNLESDQLDPRAVLIADIKTIKLPDPKAKTYNHLDEYEKKSGATQLGLIVTDSPMGLSANSPVAGGQGAGSVKIGVLPTSDGDYESRFKIDVKKREEQLKKTLVPNLRFEKRDGKSVLSLMNSDVTGPQSFLFKCIGQQIKVVIRRRKIIFHHHQQIAQLFGSLIAFDKHYNLILSNVIEKVALIKSSEDDSSNCSPDDLPKNVRRNLKTIFVRGSNVLTVSLESSESVN
ncbi:U7 snRNA-associated Sm-like protein LSm11 [Panonychus citri]|uniref:U7 snRNA-associated Sm-like protein LSm11 n=1 Tax=Panonychus citri TaxID=50023 RepID=UPI00230803AE|nr:U7 snRNA-associated Sm-like protein LSm11 [Panonychus citri]